MTNPIGQDSVTKAMIEAGRTAMNTAELVVHDSRSAAEAAIVRRIYRAMSQASPPPLDDEPGVNCPDCGGRIATACPHCGAQPMTDEAVAALTAMKGTGDE